MYIPVHLTLIVSGIHHSVLKVLGQVHLPLIVKLMVILYNKSFSTKTIQIPVL